MPRRGRLKVMHKMWMAFVVLGICAACGANEDPAPAAAPPATDPGTALPATTPVRRPDTTPPAADVGGALPATTVVRRPDSGSQPPIGSAAPEAVSEPCPTSAEMSGAGADMAAEASRLEPMIGQVLAYGSQHPEQFGSYGLIWHDGGDASVFISFTDGLAGHRQTLAGMVPFPDELIVCQVAVSGSDSEAIQAQLVEELEGRYLSIGLGMDGLAVTLAADEAELAADLQARYGDAINLYLGVLAYPLDRATSVCTDPPAESELPGLSITIEPPGVPIAAAGAQPADLTVTVTNTGDAPIRFSSGTAIGTLLDSNGRVVNSNQIAVADVGIEVDLQPGASTDLPLLVTTASCDPALGYIVPPGEYRLITEILHANGDLTYLSSQPAAITVGS